MPSKKQNQETYTMKELDARDLAGMLVSASDSFAQLAALFLAIREGGSRPEELATIGWVMADIMSDQVDCSREQYLKGVAE